MDEALLELQQQAYKVKGVDENAPAVDPRKRKAGNGAESVRLAPMACRSAIVLTLV